MKICIDDANVEKIRRIYEYYPIDGVSTNPSILAKSGRDPYEVLKEIRSIIGEEGELFVQAVSPTAEGMVEEAHKIVEILGRTTLIKIPCLPEGFKAMKQLKKEGIRFIGTAIYTAMQGFLAARLGAEYVAPYVNRIDNMGFDGVQVSKDIHDAITANNLVEENAVPAETVPEDSEIFAGINETRLKISEQKVQLLWEAQRKNDLITYLAHDLKTPLTSVLGYLTLLNDEPEMGVQQRARFTGIALRKAQRLEDLLDEIFEITRFDIANIELQKEEVNLSGMLEQIISEFEPLLTDKNLTIQSEIEKKLFLNCDVDKTERIIDNLIRNAVSYSFVNSVIHISLREEDTNAVFRFENSGKTIPQEIAMAA